MYLVIYRDSNDKNKCGNYFVSKSRNAIKHLIKLNAQTVWVYDNNGWWVSFADRDGNGNPFGPKMFPDGAPRPRYAQMYKELLKVCPKLDWDIQRNVK